MNEWEKEGGRVSFHQLIHEAQQPLVQVETHHSQTSSVQTAQMQEQLQKIANRYNVLYNNYYIMRYISIYSPSIDILSGIWPSSLRGRRGSTGVGVAGGVSGGGALHAPWCVMTSFVVICPVGPGTGS